MIRRLVLFFAPGMRLQSVRPAGGRQRRSEKPGQRPCGGCRFTLIVSGGFMRKRLHVFFLLALAVVAVGTAIVAAQSSLADFGINENQLKSRMARAVVDGYIPMYPNAKLFHAATPAVRAAFVKNALGWMKTYAESAAFQADYDKQRAAAKPTPPKPKGTPDEQFAKYLADQRQSVVEMKKSVAQMSPDMQKQLQGTVQQMEANVDKMAKDPQMSAMMKQGFAQEAES